MLPNHSRALLGAFVFSLFLLLSCAGSVPTNLGVKDDRLASCPESPNCVCSDSSAGPDAISPFVLAVPAAKAWPAIENTVREMPRCKIIDSTSDYLHAECRSAIFRFGDDLEVQLRPKDDVAAVRSASRVGYSDMGVNRERVETLRADLVAQGIVRAQGSAAP